MALIINRNHLSSLALGLCSVYIFPRMQAAVRLPNFIFLVLLCTHYVLVNEGGNSGG